MKSYVERNFGKDYVKKVNIQEVGVYYSVPVKNIYVDKLSEFDYQEDEIENGYVLLDKNTIDNYDCIENYDGVYYDYTDEVEIDSFISDLMDYKKYNNYLVVTYNCTWNHASGFKFVKDYKDCFYRNYDVSQYVTGSSKGGKTLELKEYHHDVPMGHKVVIVGLTDSEYYDLENKNFDDIDNYINKQLQNIIEL